MGLLQLRPQSTHVRQKETVAGKEKAATDLNRLNALREDGCWLEWQLVIATQHHLHTRDQARGKKPVWAFNRANSKLARESKAGGIDWYRNQEIILKKMLLPFGKRNNLTVQEDGAPAHAHSKNQGVYDLFAVSKLLWPSNSLNVDIIERC